MADIRDTKAATIVADSRAETFADAKRRGVSVEIQKPKAIKGGVEVLARAWKDGVPVGFGTDGSVEWERFRVFNPPLMVPDGTKRSITVEGLTYDVENFKEDPDEALRQSLAHTIGLVGKPGAKITSGKIGNTTSTFYPDAHPETTSVDGQIAYTGASWAAARSASAGDDAQPSISADAIAGCSSGHRIVRGFVLFDTSAIPDTDTISSATLSVYVTGVSNSDDDGDDFISVVTVTPASNTDLVTDDFDQVGSTEQIDSGERKDLGSISTSAYLDFALNATGRGNVSKTGVSKFGLREGHDLLDTGPIAVATWNRIDAKFAETAGTTEDPKLVVVHSAPPFTAAPSMFAVF